MNENTFAEPNVEETAGMENDNSTDSQSVEETDTDLPQSSEGEENSDENTDTEEETQGSETDLHKHPRWKEREDDWKTRFNDQETRHQNDLKELREEFEQKYGGKKPTESDEIPSWFGGTEEDWASFKEWNQGLINKAHEQIQQEAQAKTKAEQEAIQKATDYMEAEIASIESDKALNPDGLKIDKNKLLKFVLDNELVDTKGQWNYKAGWQLMQAGIKSAKNATLDEKKKIASATTDSADKGEPAKPTVVTSEDFENPSNRPW